MSLLGKVRRVSLQAVLTFVSWIHRGAMALDRWLYPGLDQVVVERPLFIVGVPRSGTTMLHRLIASEREVFTTMPLWEVLFAPALCQKRLLSRLNRIDRFFGGPIRMLVEWCERFLTRSIGSVHPTSLTEPEEDYLALLPFGGCFLQVLAMPRDRRTWQLAEFGEQMPESERVRLRNLYRKIVQRHLYFRGTELRLLSKNPSFTSWIGDLDEVFPDAHFIALRRDPAESLPSQLSSMRDGMAFFGHSVSDPECVERFCDLYTMYWRLIEDAQHQFSEDRFRLIEYPDLISKADEIVSETLVRFGYPLTDSGRAALAEHMNRQRAYRSTHRYAASEFGLTPQMLKQISGATDTQIASCSEASDQVNRPCDESQDAKEEVLGSS